MTEARGRQDSLGCMRSVMPGLTAWDDHCSRPFIAAMARSWFPCMDIQSFEYVVNVPIQKD
jgi:hypothetical protein